MTASTSTPGTIAPTPAPGLITPIYLGRPDRSRWVSYSARAGVPLALLALWQTTSSLGLLDPQILASPGSVIGALRELTASGQIFDYLAASGTRVALGVILGVSVGLVLGVIAGASALGEDLIDPTLQMYRAVPFLALVPLMLSWFGVGETFKIVLIAVSAIAPMYSYTYLGVRSVDHKLIEAARDFGLRGFPLVWQVILPSARPSLLMALRVSLSVSLTGLIAAEQIGTTEGIGYLVALSQQYFRSDYMVLCILLYAALGVLIDLTIRFLEHTTMPWREGVTAR